MAFERFARFGRWAGSVAKSSSQLLVFRLVPRTYLELGNSVPTRVGSLIFAGSSLASNPCFRLLWRIRPDPSENEWVHSDTLP